jgi:hypothetical protein
MMREFGTQMEKNDIYIDTRKDKIIYPRPYFSSEMWKRQREETTLYIQCRVRGYFARKRCFNLRKAKQDRENELLALQKELQAKEEAKHKEEI